MCDIWETNMNSLIESLGVSCGALDPSSAARTQATLMMTATRGFWTHLSGWMAKFYNRLMAKALPGPIVGQAVKDHETMLSAMKKES